MKPSPTIPHIPSLDLVQSPSSLSRIASSFFSCLSPTLLPVSHLKHLPSFTILFTFLSSISKMLLLLVAPLYPGMPSHFTTRLIPFLYHAVLRRYHSSGYMATADYSLSFISPRERLLWNLSLCIRSLASFASFTTFYDTAFARFWLMISNGLRRIACFFSLFCVLSASSQFTCAIHSRLNVDAMCIYRHMLFFWCF